MMIIYSPDWLYLFLQYGYLISRKQIYYKMRLKFQQSHQIATTTFEIIVCHPVLV
jgi:hypothetical protein